MYGLQKCKIQYIKKMSNTKRIISKQEKYQLRIFWSAVCLLLMKLSITVMMLCKPGQILDEPPLPSNQNWDLQNFLVFNKPLKSAQSKSFSHHLPFPFSVCNKTAHSHPLSLFHRLPALYSTSPLSPSAFFKSVSSLFSKTLAVRAPCSQLSETHTLKCTHSCTYTLKEV